MRTRRSQSSSNPMSSFDSAQDKSFDSAQDKSFDSAEDKSLNKSRDESGHRSGSHERSGHRPVLLHEAIELLALRDNDIVVDATVGGGGHAREIVKGLGGNGLFIGFDLDADAIARARRALTGARPRVILREENFRKVAQVLPHLGVSKITKALFDLGWSSQQLDSRRGFSFLTDEPLLMTYQRDLAPHALTAEKIVNEWSEESLADILHGWGEERYARRIARAIIQRREREPFRTTRALVEVILEATPRGYRRGKIHPATRTFQALRIAVNDELGALEEGVRGAWSLLAPGGRIAVIAFHSLEDRIVKRLFLAWERADQGRRVTKKPIVPSADEIRRNPRARSAKLRVFERA